MKRIPTLLAMAACLFVGLAQAQWQWKDKAGNTVFSDRPPPPDIPARSILKQPGAVVRSTAPADAPQAAASAPGAAGQESEPGMAAPKLSAVDKELADRKKQAEAAEAAKLKAEEQRQAQLRSENCNRARSGKALYDSGVRLSITNAKGEREMLDDAARATELRRIQAAMDANCR